MPHVLPTCLIKFAYAELLSAQIVVSPAASRLCFGMCLLMFGEVAFVFLCFDFTILFAYEKQDIYFAKPRIKHKYRQRVNRPKHYTNTNLTAHDVLLSHLKLAP